MKRYKQKTIIVNEEVSVVCDRCCYEQEHNSNHKREFFEIDFTGGYVSSFGDNNHVHCDLCHECLKELLTGLYSKEVLK